MADVVALRKAKDGAQLLEQYSHLLKRTDEVDEYSQLIPLDHLSMLNEVIEASLKPAARADLAKAVALLFASFKVGDVLEDRPAFTRLMIAELAVYPTDILERAIIQARRTIKWLPSIAEMIAICNEFFDERGSQLYIVQRMIGEHRRRLDVAASRTAEAERKAKREQERKAHLQKIEMRARERFGDDAPLPGDVELAVSLSNSTVYRAREPISWQAALAGGEDWAAQYCRLMALAARVIRAHDQGQVSWSEALAVVKLIVADEATARHQIEQVEGRQPGAGAGKLTEGFWRYLWKIREKCGLDVPASQRGDAAAAIENLKHLTGLAALADTRAILDHQVREQWERQQPALARVLWRGDDQTQERN